MRKLTLDEKISIKGRLATKKQQMTPGFLARLNMETALQVWYRVFGTPIAYHSTPKLWRKRIPPLAQARMCVRRSASSY